MTSSFCCTSAWKSISSAAGLRPGYRGCRASWTSFAASIRFFEGRQPRLTQVPPMLLDSVITAVLPSSCARSAAAKAVEPEPSITRFNFSLLPMVPPGAAAEPESLTWPTGEYVEHRRDHQQHGRDVRSRRGAPHEHEQPSGLQYAYPSGTPRGEPLGSGN